MKPKNTELSPIKRTERYRIESSAQCEALIDFQRNPHDDTLRNAARVIRANARAGRTIKSALTLVCDLRAKHWYCRIERPTGEPIEMGCKVRSFADHYWPHQRTIEEASPDAQA